MNAELKEERKWILASKDDPHAFEPLFNKYFHTISNYILRRTANEMLAKDITANTFMKALAQIHRFEWKGLPFSAWLYRIATNEINQYFRKNRKLTSLTETQLAVLRDDTLPDAQLIQDEDQAEKKRNAARIHHALRKINQKYQDVLTLRYYEDLQIREIAVILDVPENTVKTHIRRGLKQLEKQL